MKNIEEFKRILSDYRPKLFTGQVRKKLALMGVTPDQYNFLRKSHFELNDVSDEVLCKIAKALNILNLDRYFDENLIKSIQVPRVMHQEKHLVAKSEQHDSQPQKHNILEDEYVYYKNMFYTQQEEINQLRKQLKRYQRLLDFCRTKPIEINDDNLQKLYLQHLEDPNVTEYKDAFIVNIKDEKLLVKSYYII